MTENKPPTEFNVWVVYDTTTIDYPGLFVARLFQLDKPTDNFYTHEDLEAVRTWIRDEAKLLGDDYNLYPIDKAPTDDPVILETWI